jgi:hypothetical protein
MLGMALGYCAAVYGLFAGIAAVLP